MILNELASFSEELARKPMFVVASKIDVAQDPERVSVVRELAEEKAMPFFEISAVTGQGIDALSGQWQKSCFPAKSRTQKKPD